MQAVVAVCMAISSLGLARNVLVYRTMTESTAQGGGGRKGMFQAWEVSGSFKHLLPYGATSAACWVAQAAEYHFHHFGLTREKLLIHRLERPTDGSSQPKGANASASHASAVHGVSDDLVSTVPFRLRHTLRRFDSLRHFAHRFCRRCEVHSSACQRPWHSLAEGGPKGAINGRTGRPSPDGAPPRTCGVGLNLQLTT